jgi:type II secretory pathway component GspD/PulD (secretin)
MSTLDAQVQQNQTEPIYFLYKLQYADPQETLAYLESISSNLTADISQLSVRNVIKTAKVIKDNNAILLTGPKNAIEDTKEMIAQYDTEEHVRSSTAAPGNFFIYKPKYVDPHEIITSLRSLVDELASTGNIDVQLQKSIAGIRYIEATHSILIPGSDKTIAQIQALLEEIDVQGGYGKGLHHVGALTFFIYKLQYVTPQRLAQSLQSVAQDLEKGGLEDQSLAAAIKGMKSITETNSVLFTGTPAALAKIQELLPNFDIAELAPAQSSLPMPDVPSGYVIYRPLHKAGDELIKMLCDFVDNLKQAGINPTQLERTVHNMRWIENTCSLLITGDPETIEKVQTLLKQFDISSGEAKVTTLGETGFLIYKLQFHQGDDIQRALRRVAADLQEANKGQKIPIADSIESLQWIPVTNSLLTSGPPSVLSRIRDLIQNLDIPLRQVFIEVLVIQTSLTNSQSFGLSWAARAQYKNKVAGQISNFQTPTADNLIPAFSPISATVTPVANNSLPPLVSTSVSSAISFLHKAKHSFPPD